MATPTAHSRLILAPKPYTPDGTKAVFLSGSIEKLPEGAPTWQERLTKSISHLPITIINPHRMDWDSTWKEDISDPRFKEQVEWELEMQEIADVFAVYFAPKTQAPVTLLELGLSAKHGKTIVACPEGFWKRGNVQIVCKRYGIELVDSLDDLIKVLVTKLAV
jgi:Nucleoside 2-deoxyribosyltransferase like